MLSIAVATTSSRHLLAKGVRAARLPHSSSRVCPGAVSLTLRYFGMKPREYDEALFEPIPPNYTLDSVKPPQFFSKPPEPEPDPAAIRPKPVTSAHAIDVLADPPRLSARDSAALGPNGQVVHGRYGELDSEVSRSVPLEYLALLRPAAEGAAALRVTLANAKKLGQMADGEVGTVVVYGASRPNGFAALQLASAAGHTVVGVVDGKHSGHDEMVDIVKHSTNEPGTAVPEEYAIVKRNFRDIVQLASKGDDPADWTTFRPEEFLEEFKQNLLDYIQTYPDTLPAAVSVDALEFRGKEKDREHFRDNLDAYLSQLPRGAPPIDKAQLDEYFTKEQYAIWKSKFGIQTTKVISGDEDTNDFEPATLVRNMVLTPEVPNEQLLKQEAVEGAGDFVPYEFSVLEQKFSTGVEPKKGGPILGAIIAVTEELRVAAEAVEKAGPSLRAKAEALQFLTDSQRNAFAAASAVAAAARDNGATICVVGGTLPGLETVEPSDVDVQEALSAMEIEEDGTSRLNYFIQVYRAGDYPVYADYAIHRATEVLAGPRQIVVTK